MASLLYKVAALLLMVFGGAAALFNMGKTSEKAKNLTAQVKARDERRKIEKERKETARRIDKNDDPDDVHSSIDRM